MTSDELKNVQKLADAFDVSVEEIEDAIEAGHVTVSELEGLTDYPFAAVVAYAKNTGGVEYFEEAYQGKYASGAEFAEEYINSLSDIPDYIRHHIDWDGIWESSLCCDYFEADGFFFRNV